ncbi:MAG: hypothetical protein JXB38_02625 [Anaerolineales bacterium]|nr:hypothetical protein [Anaerolineales bacterium]
MSSPIPISWLYESDIIPHDGTGSDYLQAIHEIDRFPGLGAQRQEDFKLAARKTVAPKQLAIWITTLISSEYFLKRLCATIDR